MNKVWSSRKVKFSGEEKKESIRKGPKKNEKKEKIGSKLKETQKHKKCNKN